MDRRWYSHKNVKIDIQIDFGFSWSIRELNVTTLATSTLSLRFHHPHYRGCSTPSSPFVPIKDTMIFYNVDLHFCTDVLEESGEQKMFGYELVVHIPFLTSDTDI